MTLRDALPTLAAAGVQHPGAGVQHNACGRVSRLGAELCPPRAGAGPDREGRAGGHRGWPDQRRQHARVAGQDRRRRASAPSAPSLRLLFAREARARSFIAAPRGGGSGRGESTGDWGENRQQSQIEHITRGEILGEIKRQ